MTPEEVWEAAAAAACCAVKWKPSAKRRGSAVIRTAMEAYAAEKVAERDEQIRKLLLVIAANQHHGGNDG